MLKFEQFLEKYKPFTNFFSTDPEEIKFETYGEELEHVLIQNGMFVWTAVCSENENTYILPGKLLVNRSHYYVCANPWTDENEIVNDNDMISIENSIKACKDFFKTLGYSLNDFDVSKYFISRFVEKEITIGDAKYAAIDYWENLGNELNTEEENLLHNFYSSLI